LREYIAAALLVIGSLFVFLSGVGLIRFPDLFMRMQATTKAATLGVGSLLLALAVRYSELDITARSLLILAFIFLTAPVAAHAIARAAYVARVPLWEKTLVDEYAPEVGRDETSGS
jgi:multicomponent Na+:H+ antiporter subunit G